VLIHVPVTFVGAFFFAGFRVIIQM
jgi:hypothetical protein